MKTATVNVKESELPQVRAALAERDALLAEREATIQRLIAQTDGLAHEVTALRAENERLKAHVMAIFDHGLTTWGDTSCGSGRAGGQAMTTTAHPEVIQHLASSALYGCTLKDAADQYAAMLPNTVRLDERPRRARRAGPDGRPV